MLKFENKLYFRFMNKFICLLCFFFSFLHTNSQVCERVWIKGRAFDTLNSGIFYNLMVINKTSGQGVFGQPNGTFGVYVKPNDSIVISVRGYYLAGFRVQSDSNCSVEKKIYLEPKSREIEGVVIKPLKSIQEIKEERENLALRETKTITGLEVIQSPITALYERFSREGRSKEIVAQKEFEDKKEFLLQDLLHLYVSFDIVQLSPEEFSDFIHFMNIDEQFIKTTPDIELVTFIKDKFEHYNTLKRSKE